MRRVALALLVLAAACGGNDDDPAPAASASTSTSASSVASTTTTVDDDDVYADPASWLCRPDSDDPCDGDLDATIVQADGTTTLEPFVPATDALIDCFYVYPTVSNDPDAQSDMVPNAEEMSVVRNQAARLGSVCDVYAPMYRQATLTELQRTLGGASGFFAAVGLAYPDVLAAWRHYLAEDNDGRGVVVIGHSQGAGHLAQLLREEIDPNEDQRSLLVSGILLGNSAYASDYPNLHACAAADDTGCIASYSSFRSTAPPPANSFFARARGGEEAICTNPAAMSGGIGDLHPYFAGTGLGVDVTTEFATLPGLLTAECITTDGFHHLSLTVHGDPSGPRIDDIRGDLSPQWGMHLVDANVAMGDLVTLVRSQAAAFS